ncbi:MAG: alcohol dehydrogenase catalytic domain-containing protein [Elusimicrobia bacterium]|nr:alcohol dehydrogenase catalytic domain-containing protein [Elusimicrobiota bacterium]
MKAVVFHSVGDVRLEDVPEPRLKDAHDAIIRITTSAICGTDLHFLRGTVGGIRKGRILGHEGVGVVERLSKGVRNLREGDRVVVASTVACGWCAYCRAGYYSQCDVSNPRGPQGGGVYFGGPEESGALDGLQAELARIPYANVGLVKLPDKVTDEQAITLSDVFPTGYFGAELAEVGEGDTVAVFGCGPVGQFAILSCMLKDAARVFAVDNARSRLETARELGAETIDFNAEDPVEAIRELTGGIGVDRAIDAVGLDAYRPEAGPGLRDARKHNGRFKQEVGDILAENGSRARGVHPGNAPSLVLQWAMECLAKAGSLGIVGLYPEENVSFPAGVAVGKNLTIKAGGCPHRKYIPRLLRLIESGQVDVSPIVTRREKLSTALDAYREFEKRKPGWLKVELSPV